MQTNRTGLKFDPFLLPTCTACSGHMNLSYVEPADGDEPERRIYRCTECGAERTLRMTE